MRSQKALLYEALNAVDPLVESDKDFSLESADELLASIVGWGPRLEVPPPTRSIRRLPTPAWRRHYLIVIPLVATLLVILVAGLPNGGDSGPSTLPALARVAQAAAAQAPVDSDLPYLYMKTRSTYTEISVAGGHSWSVYIPTTQENWIARDGSGRVRSVEGPATWVGKEDREAWEASDRIPFLAHDWGQHISEEDVPPGHFHTLAPGGVRLTELPTDTTDLAAWLERVVHDPSAGAGAGNGFSPAVRTLTLVAELLNNPLAPPELRAALYEAEGLIPGVEYLGHATDQLGRHGVAVGAESLNSGAPTIYSLVFDPRTSQVLATQRKILEAPSALPDEGYPRTESTLYLASGAASSLGEKPHTPR